MDDDDDDGGGEQRQLIDLRPASPQVKKHSEVKLYEFCIQLVLQITSKILGIKNFKIYVCFHL